MQRLNNITTILDIPTVGLSEAEQLAWKCPENSSYHSFHLERMGAELYIARDSRGGIYYTGTFSELTKLIQETLSCRKFDEKHSAYAASALPHSLLSEAEIDDLLSDL